MHPTTAPTCSQLSPTAAVTSFSRGQSGDWTTALSLRPTHALIDSIIQTSPKDIFISLDIHLPLTMECANLLFVVVQLIVK